jgi:hypothetical protein
MNIEERISEIERKISSLEKYRMLTADRISEIESKYGQSLEDIFNTESKLGSLSLSEFAESLGITRNQARYWCDRLGISWRRSEGNRSHVGNPKISDINRARSFIKVTVDGKTLTLSQYCQENDIPYKRIYNRMYRLDISADDAIRYKPKAPAGRKMPADHPWRKQL